MPLINLVKPFLPTTLLPRGLCWRVQGAMLMGLSDMGLGANVFDAVYGASAGAINSTYYLSGEQQYCQASCVISAVCCRAPVLRMW
jgi:hypothetical protein